MFEGDNELIVLGATRKARRVPRHGLAAASGNVPSVRPCWAADNDDVNLLIIPLLFMLSPEIARRHREDRCHGFCGLGRRDGERRHDFHFQVGFARFESGVLVDEWKSYVDPEDYFDDVNVSIHGITDDMVRGTEADRIATLLCEHITSRVSSAIPTSIVLDPSVVSQIGICVPTCKWLDSAASPAEHGRSSHRAGMASGMCANLWVMSCSSRCLGGCQSRRPSATCRQHQDRA